MDGWIDGWMSKWMDTQKHLLCGVSVTLNFDLKVTETRRPLIVSFFVIRHTH